MTVKGIYRFEELCKIGKTFGFVLEITVNYKQVWLVKDLLTCPITLVIGHWVLTMEAATNRACHCSVVIDYTWEEMDTAKQTSGPLECYDEKWKTTAL